MNELSIEIIYAQCFYGNKYVCARRCRRRHRSHHRRRRRRRRRRREEKSFDEEDREKTIERHVLLTAHVQST